MEMSVNELSAPGYFTEAIVTRFREEVQHALKTGHLVDLLKKTDMLDMFPKENAKEWEESQAYGKVIIFGDSAIKSDVIYAVLQDLGISKDRVELHLGFKKLKHYPFGRLQYNDKYRLVIFGPLPHSTKDKAEAASILTKMRSTGGYPLVVQMMSNQKNKITKTQLRVQIEEAIRKGQLAV